MASDSIRSPKLDRHVQITCNDVIFIMEIANKEGMAMALQGAYSRMLSCKASCRDPQLSSIIGTCIWPTCMMIS